MKTVIKVIEREDGNARAAFYDHGGGLYSFEAEEAQSDETLGFGPYTYWYPTLASGLYDDPIMAEKEAYAVISWLREVGAHRKLNEIALSDQRSMSSSPFFAIWQRFKDGFRRTMKK